MIRTSEDDVFSKKSEIKSSDKEGNVYATGNPNSSSSAVREAYGSEPSQPENIEEAIKALQPVDKQISLTNEEKFQKVIVSSGLPHYTPRKTDGALSEVAILCDVISSPETEKFGTQYSEITTSEGIYVYLTNFVIDLQEALDRAVHSIEIQVYNSKPTSISTDFLANPKPKDVQDFITGGNLKVIEDASTVEYQLQSSRIHREEIYLADYFPDYKEALKEKYLKAVNEVANPPSYDVVEKTNVSVSSKLLKNITFVSDNKTAKAPGIDAVGQKVPFLYDAQKDLIYEKSENKSKGSDTNPREKESISSALNKIKNNDLTEDAQEIIEKLALHMAPSSGPDDLTKDPSYKFHNSSKYNQGSAAYPNYFPNSPNAFDSGKVAEAAMKVGGNVAVGSNGNNSYSKQISESVKSLKFSAVSEVTNDKLVNNLNEAIKNSGLNDKGTAKVIKPLKVETVKVIVQSPSRVVDIPIPVPKSAAKTIDTLYFILIVKAVPPVQQTIQSLIERVSGLPYASNTFNVSHKENLKTLIAPKIPPSVSLVSQTASHNNFIVKQLDPGCNKIKVVRERKSFPTAVAGSEFSKTETTFQLLPGQTTSFTDPEAVNNSSTTFPEYTYKFFSKNIFNDLSDTHTKFKTPKLTVSNAFLNVVEKPIQLKLNCSVNVPDKQGMLYIDVQNLSPLESAKVLRVGMHVEEIPIGAAGNLDNVPALPGTRRNLLSSNVSLGSSNWHIMPKDGVLTFRHAMGKRGRPFKLRYKCDAYDSNGILIRDVGMTHVFVDASTPSELLDASMIRYSIEMINAPTIETVDAFNGNVGIKVIPEPDTFNSNLTSGQEKFLQHFTAGLHDEIVNFIKQDPLRMSPLIAIFVQRTNLATGGKKNLGIYPYSVDANNTGTYVPTITNVKDADELGAPFDPAVPYRYDAYVCIADPSVIFAKAFELSKDEQGIKNLLDAQGGDDAIAKVLPTINSLGVQQESYDNVMMKGKTLEKRTVFYEPPHQQPQAGGVTVSFNITKQPVIKWKLTQGKKSDVDYFIVIREHLGYTQPVGALDPDSSDSNEFIKIDPYVTSVVGTIKYTVVTVSKDGTYHETQVTDNTIITKTIDVDSTLVLSKDKASDKSSSGVYKPPAGSSTNKDQSDFQNNSVALY